MEIKFFRFEDSKTVVDVYKQMEKRGCLPATSERLRQASYKVTRHADQNSSYNARQNI